MQHIQLRTLMNELSKGRKSTSGVAVCQWALFYQRFQGYFRQVPPGLLPGALGGSTILGAFAANFANHASGDCA